MSTATVGARRDDSSLRSVSTAIAVLDCFTADSELGVTEVGHRLGVAKSTASRLLATLAAGGLLERARGGRYRLGLKLFEYGQLAVDRLLLREIARPRLAELRDTFRETVQLGVPVGAEVLYVDRLEDGGNALRARHRLARVPAHASSSGRAMAAFNPRLAEAMLGPALGRHQPVLARIRRQGWASSHEEYAVGYCSVAAPILLTRDGCSKAVAAISVAGRTPRVLGLRKDAVVQGVCRAARHLSTALTYDLKES